MKENFYSVLVGDKVVFESPNRKPAIRRALSLAKNKDIFVEVCYLHSNGSVVLVSSFNDKPF